MGLENLSDAVVAMSAARRAAEEAIALIDDVPAPADPYDAKKRAQTLRALRAVLKAANTAGNGLFLMAMDQAG